MDEKEKIKKLVDHYYGDCRSDSDKEAVADFVVNYYDEIRNAIETEEYLNAKLVV